MSFKLQNGPNRYTEIHVMGEREPGGNFTEYHITSVGNEAMDGDIFTELVFQHGPVKEAGVNGIFMEDLIDICIHRLNCFQTGPYACQQNANAAMYLNAAKLELAKRTADRVSRNVEGTSKL